MKTDIEISSNNTKEVSTILNRLLANEYVLAIRTRSAHWNVQGPNFIGLHGLFQKQYEEIDVVIDDIAERVRSLGHFALGLLKDFLSVTDLVEDDAEVGGEGQIIEALLYEHEAIIRIIRNEVTSISTTYRDLGTADFVTGIMQKHEKMAWMLRAHIEEN
jgi:starvation-inducible DNA-binding protein